MQPPKDLDIKAEPEHIKNFFLRFDIWWNAQSKSEEKARAACLLGCLNEEAFQLITNLITDKSI